MIINKDYSRALRTGYHIDKRQYRREQEAGFMVGIPIILATLSVLVFILLHILFKA